VLATAQVPSDWTDLFSADRIVIVGGAGTIGSSTALHLCRRGYKNITLLDVYGFPSDYVTYGPSQSAGAGDINKHIGTSYSGTRGEISDMTMDMWRNDPVFKDYYHEVGEVSVYVSCPRLLATGVLTTSLDSLQQLLYQNKLPTFGSRTKQS
jgi:hypothetical protein